MAIRTPTEHDHRQPAGRAQRAHAQGARVAGSLPRPHCIPRGGAAPLRTADGKAASAWHLQVCLRGPPPAQRSDFRHRVPRSGPRRVRASCIALAAAAAPIRLARPPHAGIDHWAPV